MPAVTEVFDWTSDEAQRQYIERDCPPIHSADRAVLFEQARRERREWNQAQTYVALINARMSGRRQSHARRPGHRRRSSSSSRTSSADPGDSDGPSSHARWLRLAERVHDNRLCTIYARWLRRRTRRWRTA